MVCLFHPNNLKHRIYLFVFYRRGDITTLDIDCIVNAANKSLLGGGGVDGAIHKAAGRKLLEECKTLMGCFPGEAKITDGYDLPAESKLPAPSFSCGPPHFFQLRLINLEVIHTAGPIYFTDVRAAPDLLSKCYWNSLDLVKKYNLRSVAFPSLSTGIYGYAHYI